MRNSHGESLSAPTPVSKRARNVTLALLTATYFSSYVDRQILAIMQERLKADLALSDTQLGLLSGLIFAVFYATLALPVARIAETANRRNIVAISAAIWSVMTATCGLAQNFTQLALSRIGVGIGEAGSMAPSQSMIADLFPPSRRASAMAIFSLGSIMGAGFGTMLGGIIANAYGWRVAMFSLGLPGLLLAAAVRFIAIEPTRVNEGISRDPASRPTIMEGFRSVGQCPAAMHLIAGMTLISLIGYSVVGWGPSYMQRSLGLDMVTIAQYIAIPGAILGGVSALSGGVIADRVAARYGVHAQSWVVAACQLCALPFSVSFYLASSPGYALTGYFGFMLFSSAYLGASMALVQYLAPPHLRAVWAAIMLLTLNLVGLGVGPLLVGQISDLLRPRVGDESLRYAMLAVTLTAPLAIYLYLRAGSLMKASKSSG